MQKTYKLVPPKHISEKKLAEYNIATLTTEQVDRLCSGRTKHFTPNLTFFPHTITINGLAQPWGEACKHCTSRTKNNAAHHARHCLNQLANGHCKYIPAQNLGKILFPDANYDEKQRKAILTDVQDVIAHATGIKQTITPEMDLEADLAMDSFEIFCALEEIEDKQKIVLPDGCELQTVGDIVNYVHKHISKQR